MADAGSIGVNLSASYQITGVTPPAVVGIPVMLAPVALAQPTTLLIGTQRATVSFTVTNFVVSGTVEVLGVATSGYVVRAFRRDNGVMVGETISGAGGAFSMSIIGDDPEVTVLAYDNTSVSPDFNAVVADRVVPL